MKLWKETTLKYIQSCDRKEVNKTIKEIKKEYGRKISHKLLFKLLLEEYFSEILKNVLSVLNPICDKGNCCYRVPAEATEMQEKGYIEGYGNYYEEYDR